MFDYILTFPNETAARADSIVGQYFSASSGSSTGGSWRGDCVIPIVQLWNPANDTTVPVSSTSSATMVVHQNSSGWECLIAEPVRQATLDSHAKMVVILDRDAANAGALPAQYIKGFNPTLFPNIISLLNTCRFQPVYAGSHYPQLGVS